MIEMDALLQRLTLFTNLYCEFRVLFAIRFVFIKMHCIVFLKFSAFLKYLVFLGVDSIIYYGIKIIKIIIRILTAERMVWEHCAFHAATRSRGRFTFDKMFRSLLI